MADDPPKDFAIRFSYLAGPLAMLVSVVSAYLSWEANTISREAYRRASGRMFPLFTVEGNLPHLLVVGDRAVDPVSLPVTLRNDGDEAIEAVRYEISMDIIWSGDRATEKPIKPTRVSHDLFRIILKGESVPIDIAPDVVAHIKTLGIPSGMKSFWTVCRVSFSAKLVGSNYFASVSDEKDRFLGKSICSFGVSWDARPGLSKEPANFGVGQVPSK